MQAIQKALWRWASSKAAGEETLEAVVVDLHTGGLVLVVAFLKNEAVQGIRQPNWATEQTFFFRIALLTPLA